jgi:hypothetical protein
MKYFTKEWYELCQKTGIHLLLEEEEQAETFSEEYFQQLYSIKLNNWLDLQQKIASYIVKPETVDGNYVEYEQFGREKLIDGFYNQFIYNQEYIKKVLPHDILKDIADIRVFVLDKATRNVIDAVTQFCDENKKSVHKTIEKYKKYYKKALKSFDKNMVENIRFHDCMIVNSNKKDKCLTLFLDNTGGLTDIDEVVSENYNIINQDDLLESSCWLYDEIYKVNDKYELHALLQNKNMDLIDFIISVDNITFHRNKNN